MAAPLSNNVVFIRRMVRRNLSHLLCGSPLLRQRWLSTVQWLDTKGSPSESSRSRESLAEQFSKASGGHHRRNICRTSEDNPLNHGADKEALFYAISAAERQRWMRHGLRPSLYKMMKAFNENCLMVRKPATELFAYMQMTNYDLPVIRYVLHGRLGTGKSCTLAHLMHYCGRQDWLIVHVPWAAFFLRYYRETQLSTFHPGRVDQPLEAADLLASFRQTNEPRLQQLNLQIENRYVWSKREISEIGTPWLDMIEFGLSRTKYATDVLGALLKEIRLQASAKRFKALVAIDGVNAFWSPTSVLKTEDDPRVKHSAGDMTLVQHYRRMIQNDWSNGAVVCTVDRYAIQTDDTGRDSHLPQRLLGKEGSEWFDPYIPIKMPDYTEKEAISCLQYYADRQWIQNPKGMTDEGQKEMMFLSSCNPLEMYNITATR